MVRMMIQVAAGSAERMAFNESTLEYLETRHISRPYPYPNGFIVGTRADDGDCVDCYLITHDVVIPGSIVECEPVGLMLQDEGGEMDHKILAVLPGQAADLGPGVLEELQTFIYGVFSSHSEIEIRVGPILPREDALKHLQDSSIYPD